MKAKLRNFIPLITSLLSILLLFAINNSFQNLQINPLYWLLFTALMTYTTATGIPLGGGEVSLVPMISFSAMLVMGIIPTAMAEITADVLFSVIRVIWPEKVGWGKSKNGYSLLGITTANISMHVISVIAAGLVFYGLGGTVPITSLEELLIIFISGAAYLATNYLLASFFLLFRSVAHVIFLFKELPQILVYEGIPLIFSAFVSTVLTELGITSFIIFSLSLMMIARILRDQVASHRNLERRIQELGSLQAVGQSLSASLDIRAVGNAIYHEISKFMPVNNYYLALYNPKTNEVSFQTVFEEGIAREWPPRAAGNGLSEMIIQTRAPLLIEKNVKENVEAMGLEHYGTEAYSWLGVPIMVGEEAIGMMAVQSFSSPKQLTESFDQSHQEILTTISSQASIAIQNAQLYQQTDEALSQRVQQLNSIMSTASEGFVLIDENLTIVEANRTIGDMLGVAPEAIIGRNVTYPFESVLDYLRIEDEVMETLSQRIVDTHVSKITLEGKRIIPVERSVTLVWNEQGQINGWLLAFRDLTKEEELNKFRDDLTRMLVHDLRSPIVNIQGGLDMIENMIGDGNKDILLEMVDISRKGTVKMFEMINELLNINKLESGEMTLQRGNQDLPALFAEEQQQMKSLWLQANISIKTEIAPNFPLIPADRNLMKRVFHNLLDNAIKYTPDGGTITFSARPDPKNERYVLVSVQDTGAGIPYRVQKSLFQKYYTNQEEKSRRKGTGLGLHFCKLVAEAHQGDILVDSAPNKGSTFTLRLPVAPN